MKPGSRATKTKDIRWFHTNVQPIAKTKTMHGHHRNRAFMGDAVKREAVRKAGIRLLEVPAEYDAQIVENQVGSVLRPNSRCRTALDSRFARE